MYVDFLIARFKENAAKTAIVYRSKECTYGELSELFEMCRRELAAHGVAPNAVVSLEADFSPRAVAILLALIDRRCIVVPLTDTAGAKIGEFREIAEIENIVTVRGGAAAEFAIADRAVAHELLKRVKGLDHPALIVFSSGSTGKSKAAIHDFVPLLEKFKVARNSKRMISFLLFDHLGGVNTLLYCLSNAGCLVTVEDRSPRSIVDAIEKHRVQILPTSPTFLNLLLLSHEWEGRDLSSLELITYGTEPMLESTLKAVAKLFPKVTLQQTYGLSELGVLSSKSRASNSLWVRIGGEGFETRVVDGLLEIKARSAMLGYLNAPSPFTVDGWLKTGDAVEVDGEWFKILGRKSELINVGGEKLFPAEVESVLQSMDGVEEALVSGEPNPIVGTMVKASVHLSTNETASEFRKRMWRFCKGKLAPYKIPQKVEIKTASPHTERFKKNRAAAA